MSATMNHEGESDRDVFDRKFLQAETLARSLTGEGLAHFRTQSEEVQDGVIWTLADLLTEARRALEAWEGA